MEHRKAVAQTLRPIYGAASEQAAELAYRHLQTGFRHQVPTLFLVFPSDIRRVIHTTNAIDSLNMLLRKIIKKRGHFPCD